MHMFVSRKCLKLLVVLTFTFAVVTLIRQIKYVRTVLPRKYTPKEEETLNVNTKLLDTGKCAIPQSFINDSQEADSLACKVPYVDPFNEYVMKAIRPVKKIRCEGRLYTEYENNVLRVLDDVTEESQVDEIFAEPFYRYSDYNVAFGKTIILNLTKREAKVTGDFLKITVRFRDGSKKKHFHASITEITDVVHRKETQSSPLNIMVLGLDRTSAAHFQRMLPKTYAFLKDKLGSIIFRGHSIVGPNTTPAMSAFLTGKSLEENCKCREARKGVKNASTVDEWPFIFKDLKRLGFATMWSEDQPGKGAFHLRLRGFKDQPTDHYGRTLWQQWQGICMNSQPQYELQLKYLKSFMKSYPAKRKFGFIFLSDLCHRTPHLLSAGDEGFLGFFESLKNESLLNDTMFITMSDHGPTYSIIRNSPQGGLEHRLPFLSLTFPPWFKSSYPEQVAALVKNSRIITSPFDLHATMKHLLTFPEKHLVKSSGMGESLFEPLPENRTCKDTGIPDNYCPCLKSLSIDISHAHVSQAVKVAVRHINKLLAGHSMTANLCHMLELKAIYEAFLKLQSSESHLDRENVTCSYQIKFQTTPGDGLFEGLLRMNTSGDFEVYGEIDRVNMYGDQPRCIAERIPSMRPYCLCK